MAVYTLQVHSEPAISGVNGSVAEDNSITISGNGFGQKPTPTPQPWLWDTFEKNGPDGGYVGANQAIIGQWEVGEGSNAVRYSSAKSHAGSRSAWHPFKNGIYNVSLSKNATFSKFYMEYWFYVDRVDNNSRNFKPWRLYGKDDTITYRYGLGCNYQNMNIDDTSCKMQHTYWVGKPVDDGVWYHYQVYFKESDPATTQTGRVIQYSNDRKQGDKMTKDWDITAQTRCAADRHLSQLRIGHYWGLDAAGSCAANGGADIYVDNVYIDNGTWAHIELGNNADYDSCTVREVQIPTAWSDSSITIKVNQGNFNKGEAAFLYVVDDNGNVNKVGYKVDIGAAAAASSSITAPTNLHRVVP